MKKQMYLVMLTCLSLIAQAQTVIPSYVPTNSLVGWWPFNGNANDLSINANNGTVISSSLTTDRFGSANKAYWFNGLLITNVNRSRIQIPNIDINNYNTGGFTISYWFTREDSINSTARHFMLWQYNGINGLQVEYTLNTLRHSLRTASANPPEINYFHSFTGIYKSWHHAVYIWSPYNLSTYIDGVLVNTQSNSGITNLSTGQTFEFGTGGVSGSSSHSGKMDDIGIWNRALTLCEVKKLYYAPSFSAAASNPTICAGQSLTLTAGGAPNYAWSNGANTASAVVTPSTSIIYTVTSTYTTGCTDTKTVSVTVNAKPTITINSPSICVGQSATLTASGATTYTWNTNSNSTSIVVSPSVSTNYTVNGTNTNGCSNTKSITVTVNAKPTITINSPSICVGQSATLTASGATTYTWNTNSNSTSIVVSPSVSTNYTVNGTNTNGCSNTKSITVTVNACTGINEAQLPNELSVYPNPTKDNITVVSSPNFIGKTYSITDQLGKLITNGKLTSNNMKISLSSFPNGLYFVKIEGQTFKIVKE